MYHPYYNNGTDGQTQAKDAMSMDDLDKMLNSESEKNKNEGWNKLDRTIKASKLNSFADKYGETNRFTDAQILQLKGFLRDCLDKSKLKNTKDVHYNKETKEVMDIPSLVMNGTTHNFTLKNIEAVNKKKTVKAGVSKGAIIKEKKQIVITGSDDDADTHITNINP